MSLQSLKNDAKLLVAQVSDAASQGGVLLAAAVVFGALAITLGLILVAVAGRTR